MEMSEKDKKNHFKKGWRLNDKKAYVLRGDVIDVRDSRGRQNIAPIKHRAIWDIKIPRWYCLMIRKKIKSLTMTVRDGISHRIQLSELNSPRDLRAPSLHFELYQSVSYNGAGSALIHVWSDSGGIPGHDLRPAQL
jgi:hypothetical protein